MFSLSLAFPFTLGLVAAFNPCGFAMLPVYVGFFLGKDGEEQDNVARNIFRALKVGGVLTLGFVAVFGAFGVLLKTLFDSFPILEYVPWVTLGLGILLVPLGIAMVFGYELKLNTPRMQKGGDSGELLSMFLFGVSYAVVSLGCTIGLFIPNVIDVFNRDGWFDGVAVFLAYAIGMGAVIMTLTLAMALAKTSIATNMRKILPWVNRISGVLMTLAGVYLAIYAWYEIQVFRGNFNQNSLVTFFENMQNEVNIWIDQTGATRLGAGLLVLVGLALVRALWGQMGKEARIGSAAGLGGVWIILELLNRWQAPQPNIERNAERFNLFIKPVYRTIVGFPGRIGNWFSDPLRWGVLGEIVVLGIVGLAIYFRFFRSDDSVSNDGSPSAPDTTKSEVTAAAS